jgi:hypothetical protein
MRDFCFGGGLRRVIRLGDVSTRQSKTRRENHVEDVGCGFARNLDTRRSDRRTQHGWWKRWRWRRWCGCRWRRGWRQLANRRDSDQQRRCFYHSDRLHRAGHPRAKEEAGSMILARSAPAIPLVCGACAVVRAFTPSRRASGGVARQPGRRLRASRHGAAARCGRPNRARARERPAPG